MTPPGLERYIAFMSTLAPSGFGDVDTIVTDDMHFRDPFNDVRGRAHFVRCLEDMLEQLADLKIVVTHLGALAPQAGEHAAGERWALYWRFSGRLRKLGNRPWLVTGLAVVTLAADGRVSEHLDYWDAAGGLYEKLPLIGGLMRWLRQRFAVA